MSEETTQPYAVERHADGWRVMAPGGGTLLECRDEHSARHYADLLTKAYRAGYKSGYRAGRAQ